MSDQPQLFDNQATPAPTAQPDPPEENTHWWIAEILDDAALRIIQEDTDLCNFHPEDQKRLAGLLADKMAQTAEWELLSIAMINGLPPWDDDERGIPD